MAFIMHDEGMEWEAKVAYSEEDTVPANFYLGLCNDTLVKGDTLADILGEPTGNGYARAAIPSSALGMVVTTDGLGIKTSYSGSYTASGGDIGPFNTWFLATSIDGSGKLICSGPAVDTGTRTIEDGDSYTQNAYIKRENK